MRKGTELFDEVRDDGALSLAMTARPTDLLSLTANLMDLGQKHSLTYARPTWTKGC